MPFRLVVEVDLPRRILLVDDEVDLLHVLADAITHLMPDVEVTIATNLEQAEAVDLGEIGLLVVDHTLGGRTGLDFLAAIRGDYPNLPAVLFTGQAPADIGKRAGELGATVLWKPIRLRDWLEVVQRLLAD